MRVHKIDDGFRYEVESILYAQLLSLPRTITLQPQFLARSLGCKFYHLTELTIDDSYPGAVNFQILSQM